MGKVSFLVSYSNMVMVISVSVSDNFNSCILYVHVFSVRAEYRQTCYSLASLPMYSRTCLQGTPQYRREQTCYSLASLPMCNELGGNMARSTQFPIMITQSTIIYEIVIPGAAGSSIYI